MRSRGAGGPDTPDNVVDLCRRHHSEQHTLGWPEFASRYPVVLLALMDRGWALAVVLGQRRLIKNVPED